MNSFLNLIDSPVLNTDNVIRYSLMNQAIPETLSMHITDVALMSYIIASHLTFMCDEDIDLGEVLEKAVLHDLDEVLTGDVVRPTKYYNDDIHNSLDELAKESIDKISDKLGSPRLSQIWRNAKSGKSGCIIKLVDMLCVSKKSIIEVKLRGNNYFQKVAYEMVHNIEELIEYIEESDFDFNENSEIYLLDLLSGAKDSMLELIDDDIVENYGVLYGVLDSEKGRNIISNKR